MFTKSNIINEKKQNKKLFENAVALYIMKFAGYLFSLLIVPYQARVLSQEYYGALSLSMGVMLYFTMLIDFGFMVSGVTEISKNRDNPEKLSECLTCVMIIRVVLAIISIIIMMLLVNFIPSYTPWATAFYIYLTAIIFESMLPMFFLRGMEDMKTVAILTLLSKALMTMLIFIFVKSDQDYLLVPLMRVAGAVISFIIACIYINHKYHVKIKKVSWKQIYESYHNAVGYFLTGISFAIYRGGNTIILGLVFPPATVALYSCPEKLMSFGVSLSSPLSDSLLPHIAKTHNYNSAFNIIKLILPFVIIGGTIGMIWAEPIMGLIFGSQYMESANVLRSLIPIIAITPINYILAFPVLVPMGLGKQSNYANVVGIIIYISGNILLFITNKISIVSVALILMITEFSVTSWRVYVLIRHRHFLNQN